MIAKQYFYSTAEPDIGELIEKLPLLVREKILKELFSKKMTERMNLGWARVHSALIQKIAFKKIFKARARLSWAMVHSELFEKFPQPPFCGITGRRTKLIKCNKCIYCRGDLLCYEFS